MMQTMIVGAVIFAVKVIISNLHTAGSPVLLLLGAAIIISSILCMVRMYVIEPSDERIVSSTSEYARRVHLVSNEELVRCFILGACPQVRSIYLRDDNSICLRGRHSMHLIEFHGDGAEIFSEKKNYRADKEACAIMKYLAAEQN